MHRRSYYPQSTNQQITFGRARRNAERKANRKARERERDTESRRAAATPNVPGAKPSLFARLKRVMTTPISLPRMFRSR